MKPKDPSEQDVFVTGTSISETESWIRSIWRQIRDRRERRNAPALQITAAPDESVLASFVQAPSLIASLKRAISDTFNPPKIETSVAPVEVDDIWSKDPHSRTSGIISLGVHALIVIVLLIPMATMTPPILTDTSVTLLSPPPMVLNLPDAGKSGGGGGGGMKTPTPPSKGVPPRGADKQLTPPVIEAKNLMPDLVVEPTVVAPQLAHLPQFNFNTIGDLNGVVGPPSAGPGTGGGIGTGDGRGVGEGDGPGVGPGKGGGTGGGAFQVGGGVTQPRLTSKIDPEYSEDGRKARAQGTVEMLIVVREDGTVDFKELTKRLGFGLDQKAIDAVRKWRFQPGLKDGKPVPVYVSVLVNFTLR